MKKLIVIVALFFLLITYGNYRKHQLLSRAQDYQPRPKTRRARSLSYDEMAARKRAEKADSLFQATVIDSTISDSNTISIIDSVDETIIIEPDTTMIDTLKTGTVPDSL